MSSLVLEGSEQGFYAFFFPAAEYQSFNAITATVKEPRLFYDMVYPFITCQPAKIIR